MQLVRVSLDVAPVKGVAGLAPRVDAHLCEEGSSRRQILILHQHGGHHEVVR